MLRENVPAQLWRLTFGLAVLEGDHALVLGEQPPSAGEAARAPRLRLVRAHWAGLAGPEAIWGEEAWGALAWKSGVMAQAGGRSGRLSQDPALDPHLPWGRGPWLGVVSGAGGPGGKSWAAPRPVQMLPVVQALCSLGQAWLHLSH